MLAAGLDGIKRGLKPPAAVNKNIYHLTDEEQKDLGIEGLPPNLEDALAAFEDNEVLRKALGDHIFDAYLSEKWSEWREYRAQVHQWALDRYMESF